MTEEKIDNIKNAKKAWEVYLTCDNITKVADVVPIKRPVLSNIFKYTTRNMYLDTHQENDLLAEKSQELEASLIKIEAIKKKANGLLSKVKKENNTLKEDIEELEEENEELEKVQKYKTWFWGYVLVSVFVGFFLGGFFKDQVSKMQGYIKIDNSKVVEQDGIRWYQLSKN